MQTQVLSLRSRIGVAVVLAMFASVLSVVVGPKPAEATPGVDDYPYASSSACPSCQADPWSFYKRECTSFVAWRLNNDNGLAFSNNMGGGHFGNAGEWKDNAVALGYTYNSTPAVGAVAWWDASDAPSVGHVAWVRSISGNNVTIEEYNWNSSHSYNVRTIAANNPTGYLHLKDMVSSPSPVPWYFENLDGDAGSIAGNNANLGGTPAVVQFDDDLHGFYTDASSGYLRHAHATTTGWNFEVLDGAGGASGRLSGPLGSAPTTLVVGGVLHVTYYDNSRGDLRHAWSSDGTSWSFETLDGAGGTDGRYNANVGQSSTMVVGADGVLRVFYHDVTNGNLRHGWKDGSGWHFQNLDGDAGSIAGLNASLGGDPAATVYGSNIQLFYRDATNGNLRHAWFNGTTWYFENLDGDAGSVGHLNADLGSNPTTVVFGSTLQVLYYDVTNGNLRHAWSDATGWHFENLDGDAGSISGYNASVGLTPTATVLNGYLQLFYYDQTGGNLRHAWISSGTSWYFETLDGSGGSPSSRVNADVGWDPAAVTYDGHVQLLYYDNTSGNLRHSWSQ